MSTLVNLITSEDRALRDQSLDAACRGATLAGLLEEAQALEAFRRQSDNLYARVRALFFLYAIHRFHVPRRPDLPVRHLWVRVYGRPGCGPLPLSAVRNRQQRVPILARRLFAGT